VLLSPLLLVRILPVAEYGSYREFLVYFGMLLPLVSFGIARSLPYLIPKYPEKERNWITQTALFVFMASSVTVLAIYPFGDMIRANASFDFVVPLQLYVFFFINLDFLELYWLGKKRVDLVLYYSTGRLVTRMILVVALAYLTRDARTIVLGLIVLEMVRWLLVLIYTLYRRWLTWELKKPDLALQASYFVPLGSGAVVEQLNTSAGMLFISILIGPETLAFYAIGAFATKIVDILRGAIADAIFPDIVEIKTTVAKDALPLWRKATVWYCILMFPTAILFSYYSDAIVTVLFTADYAPAIPVFAIFSLRLFLACFDFHLPLRVQNSNRYYFIGSIFALVVNLALIYPLYTAFGLVGPALAYAISRVVNTVYLGVCALAVYDIDIPELVHWRDVGKTFFACLICLPILIAGKFLVDGLLLRAIVFGGTYLLAFLVVLRTLGIWDAFATFQSLTRAKSD
jgi:O-antigen/teichoic acid export membrane protein